MPRRTVRLRLTMLYGGLFLVAGAALLAITYGLVADSTDVRTGKSVFVDRQTATSGKLPPIPANLFAVSPDGRREAAGPTAGGRRSGAAGRASGTNAIVQLQAYAGKVTAVFKRLTRAPRRRS